MTRKLAVLFLVALCLGSIPGVATAAPATFTPGAPGIGDPYYPLDGNGGYDVQHYLLDVSYEPSTDQLTGVATITALATQNLSSFNLDFVGLTVRSIDVDRRAATWTRDAGELTVTPRQGIADGHRFTAVVRYDGVPETIIDAFGASGFFHTDDGALVVGEPHVAATWFPANDHPRDKAAFTFDITVPEGLEAVANGVLKRERAGSGPDDPGDDGNDGDGQNGDGQQGDGSWSTWTWDAVEPMATYLAGMGIGEFFIRDYVADGIKYWDAIDPRLLPDLAPPIMAEAGDQFLYSQIGEPAYKRLTRTIDVPPGGATLSFRVNRDTEPGWDFLFVEARTAGGSDWTTLPDFNGHTSQDTGACPGFIDANPFLEHYLAVVPEAPCEPVGTSGAWHAASGTSAGWEDWVIELANTGTGPRQVEVSITYASDFSVQGRGVVIDDIVSSTGQGTTSFVADGDPLDGWVAPIAGPEGSADNPNTWDVATFVPAIIGHGASALVSFDRQPEIIAFEAGIFGPYPFSAAGGIVDVSDLGFALENQTRPIYASGFFNGPAGNDSVVVHELAHQWFGDSLALHAWQHIWLNEGFATYAEWLWSEREGFGTAQEIFDFFSGIPADDPFWELIIGDPGPDSLFDFPIYARGALTLHALRLEVGDTAFFAIVREWARRYAGGNVTTDQFIGLAEELSGQDLDALFNVWLFTSGKPDFGAALRGEAATSGISVNVKAAPAAVRSLAERLNGRPGNPY